MLVDQFDVVFIFMLDIAACMMYGTKQFFLEVQLLSSLLDAMLLQEETWRKAAVFEKVDLTPDTRVI